jgi:hypothetical protein
MGIIHFSEELAQNPLKTIHCLSFDEAKLKLQLPKNRSSGSRHQSISEFVAFRILG